MPFDQLFRQWELWKQRSTQAQALERELRAEVVKRLCPSPVEGTQHIIFDLPGLPHDQHVPGVEYLDGGRWDFVLQHKINRTIDRPLLDNLMAQSKTLHPETQEPHPLAGVNWDLLVVRKPEVAVQFYKKGLTDVQRTWFDTCLKVSDGSPQIEIKAPKK